jgi:L-methionine (R)-S-oxide reductase
MAELPANLERGDDFEPRRSTKDDELLTGSGQIAVVDVLALIAAERRDRLHRATRAAAVICRIGPYRWVGIYDIDSEDAHVIAWSGVGPPAFVRFPNTAGLTGEAVRSKKTVVTNDVSKDPRYITSFVGTRAEIIVPVLNAKGVVVGSIDVESDKVNAFALRDQKILEQCGMALAPLWAQ